MKGKITVIDDDKDLRDLLQIALRAEGFEVRVYANGDEFLREVRAAGPSDLYVIDLNLGGTSGFEVCKHIKSIGETKNSRVIMISANPEVQQLTTDACADDYIMKPFSQRDLINRIFGLMRV